MRDVLLVLAVFLACAVEAVEALTIVLAVGVSRGWRSSMQGVAAGLLALAVVVAALGPALTLVPLNTLRLLVGGLLLVFGLGWLRKAILRASRLKDIHDEDAIYARELTAARAAERDSRAAVGDWYAFTLSFKGVLLEGLEVVFIVMTFGSNQGSILLAVLGAASPSCSSPSPGRRARPPGPGTGEHAEVRRRGVADLLRHASGVRKAPARIGPVRDAALLGVDRGRRDHRAGVRRDCCAGLTAASVAGQPPVTEPRGGRPDGRRGSLAAQLRRVLVGFHRR